MDKLTDIVGKLIYGKKPKGYGFMSLLDIRELYDIWCCINDKPEFINGNCKKVLDACGIETVECGIGWKVA